MFDTDLKNIYIRLFERKNFALPRSVTKILQMWMKHITMRKLAKSTNNEKTMPIVL